MGILDDIKNMKAVSIKVFTAGDLIKIMNKIPFSGKGNKNIKRYRNGQSNYQMNKTNKMKVNPLTKEQELEFNRGLWNMHILKGQQPNSNIAEYFYRLGLDSPYRNNKQ